MVLPAPDFRFQSFYMEEPFASQGSVSQIYRFNDGLKIGAIQMNWRYSPFSTILFVGASILIVIAFLAWRRRPVAGSKTFTLLVFAMAEWVFAYAMELAVPSLAAKIFRDKIEFFGIILVPFAWVVQTLSREKEMLF